MFSLFNSTVASNTAPSDRSTVRTVGTMVVRSSIIAKNIAGSTPDVSGTFVSQGWNLIGNVNGGSGFGPFDQTGVDPLLGPLADNGGPTKTMALRAGSPAIDGGNSFGLITDQRGAPRPFDFASIPNASGDGSDVGAVELGRPTLNIQKFNTNAVLSWQSFYGDFTLQSVTNVAASNSWAAVVGTPVAVGNQYVLTNGPISSNRFYRLKAN